MKIERQNRTLVFTDLPERLCGLRNDCRKLEVDLTYRGQSAVYRAIPLDHAVLPLLAASADMKKVIDHLFDYIDGGSHAVDFSSLIDTDGDRTLGDAVRAIVGEIKKGGV